MTNNNSININANGFSITLLTGGYLAGTYWRGFHDESLNNELNDLSDDTIVIFCKEGDATSAVVIL